MESQIYSRYNNDTTPLLSRFGFFNHVDSIAKGDITKYDDILNINFGAILLYTDMYLQKLQIEEIELNKQKRNIK